MTPEKKPYYLSNKEWYYYDPDERKYKLTEKAPPEAIKSYEEFYEILKKSHEPPKEVKDHKK